MIERGERGDRFFVPSNLFSSFDGLVVSGEGELAVDWTAGSRSSSRILSMSSDSGDKKPFVAWNTITRNSFFQSSSNRSLLVGKLDEVAHCDDEGL
jgi:hypothetical protein